MTYTITSNILQCQNHHLTTQLHAGIRYFDLRARLNNNTLFIYHEDTFTGFRYTSVLLTLFNFLETNPGEAILMRLKEEAPPINSTIDFLTAFNNYRLADPTTSPGSAKHLWLPETPGPTTVPTLGAIRGKILLLQNFGPDPAQYGIKWESPLLSIEDSWAVPDLYGGLDAKFEAVVAGLENAGNGKGKRDGVLYLTHLSASDPVLPIEVAAGTRNGSIVGINDRTGYWLRDGNGDATGVVIIDFPGRELVRRVLDRN
ncbi:hypothetical protein B7494_g8227 [Chlorociboria aeruginascens]|nr:hypothetical protein B7494_g8227 [Chlorociboria aeruginascens]